MKSIKFIRLQFLILGILSMVLSLPSCDPDDDNEMLYKPNIYIYPKENIQLTVHIDFPLGGKVVASIPEYKNGWEVSVASTGIIDSKYTFLFFESTQPNIWQTKNGWIVEKSDLKEFFQNNMSLYGFEGQEIQDFIDFWIPRLDDHDYYSICPQTSNTINKAVQLRFSKEPERILRLYYVIKGRTNSSNELIKPEIPSFERKGYFVTEWGVII